MDGIELQLLCGVRIELPIISTFNQFRDAVCGGVRQLYGMKWLKSENLQSKLLFLDINSCYINVAANMEFPIGKLEILIHRDLDDVEYKNGLLIRKNTHEQLQGLIKLLVLQNPKQEPFFIVKGKEKGKERTYHTLCIKCLKKKKQQNDPCQHSESDRAIEITTTTDALLWALEVGNCEIVKILEIWNFPEKSFVLKKFLDVMITYKDQEQKPIKKMINKSLQCAFGKFSMKPITEKQKICNTYEDLNEALCKENVIDITNETHLVDVTYTKIHRNERNPYYAITLGMSIF